MLRYDELSDRRRALALFALFLASFASMGEMVLTPIVDNLYAVFADDPIEVVNFGISGMAIASIFFIPVAGWLCDRCDKRTVLVVSFLAYTLSAVFGALIENVYYWCVCRTLNGVSWAFVNISALSAISQLSRDEDEHGKAVGWYNGVMSLIGACLAYLSGLLAFGGWQSCYRLYLACVPILIIIILFVPKLPPLGAGNSTTKERTASRKWWVPLVPLVAQVFFVAVCFYQVYYMISVFVSDANAGDSAFVGMTISLQTLASAIASVLFGFLYSKIKTKICLPALLVMSGCFLLMAAWPNEPCIVACMILFGFSWSVFYCYIYTACTDLTPASRSGRATSTVAISCTIGGALATYLMTGLISATNLNTVELWPVFGIALLIAFGASCVYFLVKRPSKNRSQS